MQKRLTGVMRIAVRDRRALARGSDRRSTAAARPAPTQPSARFRGRADGHPDLHGHVRPRDADAGRAAGGLPAGLTDEEAAKLEKNRPQRDESARRRRSTAIATAPPKGGDGSVGAAGNVGGYNNFWIDPGRTTASIDGQKRASLVIDPPDGRVPPMTPAGAAAAARAIARGRRPTPARAADDPGFEGAGAYDDPERRPLGERCLHRLRLDVGAAGAAELLLQQPPPDRADAGLGA